VGCGNLENNSCHCWDAGLIAWNDIRNMNDDVTNTGNDIYDCVDTAESNDVFSDS